MTADEIRQYLTIEGIARERARSAEQRRMDYIAILLRRGRAQGLTIKEMIVLAGISRQTAYNLLER
jgi:CRP-like cAMP-binding protein